MSKNRKIADLLDDNGDVKLTNLDNIDLTNLNASNLTSGSIPDARVPASAVSQHATSFDDNKIVNDLSTLGLRVHTQENLNASNTNSASFDVFQDSSAISNLTNTSRDSNEFISSATFTLTGASTMESLNSNRQSDYTLTDNVPKWNTSGNFNLMFDGSHDSAGISNAGLNYLHDNGATITSGNHYMRFDLGSGNKRAWSGLRMYHQNNTTAYSSDDPDWKFQGSNDGTNWTDLYSFKWTHTNQGSDYYHDYAWTPTTAHRYIQITPVGTLSTSYQTWQRQWYWYSRTFSESNNATGSFEGNPITASSTNKMGAVITYQDNAGTNALNTDIVLQLSADGGSNYSTATMTALPDFATGIKMAKVNDLSVTAGTSLKYKISFANQASGSKEARIRGVSLQY